MDNWKTSFTFENVIFKYNIKIICLVENTFGCMMININYYYKGIDQLKNISKV